MGKSKLPKGITQRGDSFRVSVTWQGVRRTGTATSLDDAVALRARLDAALKNPSSPPNSQPEAGGAWTLGHAYDRTKDTRWAGQRSEDTALLNAGIAVEYFGRTRKLDTIDTDALDGFVASLVRKGNADATINRKLAALSTMLRVAHDRGKLVRIPKMPRRGETEGRIRFLTDAEETTCLALLRQWGKLDEVDAVEVLIDTGLRSGELQRLDGQRDIDRKGKALHVWKTKGNLPRTVPCTERVWSIIQRRTITHKGKLFPYHDQWLRRTWERARDVMGLGEDEQFVTHALRHTFASRLVQKEVSLFVVQKLLGHKDIKQTMRYAHLCPTNLRNAVDALEPKAQKTVTMEELVADAERRGLKVSI